jgi:hypothetical protein
VPEARQTVADAAATGDRLKTLIALREKLARSIDSCVEAQELSSLALRLQRVLAEIHELGGQKENEEDDVLAARRDAKLRAATSS